MTGRNPRLVGPDGFTRLARLVSDDAALIGFARAEGWEGAVRTAVDCGLLDEVFARELWDRNPYRQDDTDEGGWRCVHVWIDRPECDTRACDLCGEER